MPQRLTRTSAAATVLVAIAIAAALAAATHDGTRLANDAAQYLSVADNLRAGRGVVTSIIYYEEHLAQGTVPAPQTVFPPGFPFATAAVAAAGGISTSTAAFAIALVSWAACVWLLYSIALGRGLGPAVALGCAAGFGLLALPWYYVEERLSEPLFLALTLAASRCLVGSERRQVSWTALAGVIAATAISVRYAGIFFAAAAGLVFAIELARGRALRTLQHAVAFAAPVLAVMALLSWRNVRLVGDMRGGNAYEVLKPIAEVLRTAARSAAEVVGLAARPGFAELTALVALALAVVLVARRGMGLDTEALAAATHDRAMLLTVIYPPVTVAALVALERTTSIGLQARMLVPLVPFVLLVAAEAARVLRVADRTSRVLARATVVAAVVSVLAGQVHIVRSRTERRDPGVEVALALAEPFGDGTVGDWLRARASVEHPVLGNEPQLLGALLARPVVGMATAEYTSRVWTAAAAGELVRSYAVEYVVLFPELLTGNRADRRLPVWAELAAGTVPPWLTSVHLSPKVRVYRVRFDDTATTGRAP